MTRNIGNPKSSSVIYLPNLTLPPSVKRTARIIRIIVATYPSVSTNSVLVPVLDYITKGSLGGMKAYAPGGEFLNIYVDCVALLTDYHESADGIDVLNRSVSAGCNICSFRKFQNLLLGRRNMDTQRM